MKKLLLLSIIVTLAFASAFAQLSVMVNSKTICNGSSTTLTATATGGVQPYSYTWSSGQSTSSIIVTPNGTTTYKITITDNTPSTATAQATVTVNAKPSISAQGPEKICSGTITEIVARGAITYTWGNSLGNSSSITVSPTITTTYSVTGTDGNGCTNPGNSIVTVLPPESLITVSNPSICNGMTAIINTSSGFNSNCKYIWSNTTTAKSITVSPTHTTTYTLTVSEYSDSPPSINVNCCITNAVVSVLGSGICNLIKAGTVYNDLNNNGVKDAGEPPLPNIIVHQNQGSEDYYYSTDSLGSYKVNYISGTYNINIPSPPKFSTVTPTSQTMTNATDTVNKFGIYTPDIYDVRVSLTASNRARPGFDTYYYINYENTGNQNADGYVQLVFNSGLNYTSSEPAHSFKSGNTVKWDFTNLLPGERRYINIKFNIPSSVMVGVYLNSTVSIVPALTDAYLFDNADTIYQFVTNSYDPNDKIVSKELITPNQVASEPYLNYTVNFQNTGNDTAYTVIIKDTLDENLNIPTLETIGSSHSCVFSMRALGVCEWKFNNILLPDSNINEPKSHGFVKYKVKINNTLIKDDSITNKAYIYFDANVPVLTNTAITRIDDKANDVSKKAVNTNLALQVFPNPANTQITIELPQTAKQSTIIIYNINGEEVIKQQTTNNKTKIDVSTLPCGIYFIKVVAQDGVTVRKFIKN
ncbi:MAG: T9SS type A sorting domain-containing protein [Bacteroidales bacterium]|jgi:uncharacterized repeat protein (TIGR01451 family)